MICYVDLEHPRLGPSMLSEGSEATQRKADLLTFKARFERLSGAPCLLLHFYTEHHPDGRTILANFFRLAGSVIPRPEAGAALARA